MANSDLKFDGLDEIEEAIKSFEKNRVTRTERAIEKACEDTAQYIRDTYIGNGRGFTDRTGALRRSIEGGLFEGKGLNSVGHISVGGDEIGTDMTPTRDYAAKVEFGEFSRAGVTAFLRPGTMEQSKTMLATIKEFLRPDNIL